MDTIKFYKQGQYFEFSNYYRSSFVVDNVKYSTSEAYFQSKKFIGEYSDLIAQTDSPQKAKDMGNQRINRFGNSWLINKSKPELGLVNDAIRKYKHLRIVENWEDNLSVDTMFTAVREKFRQNERLKELLISTYPNHIEENSPTDYYWGIGKDGTGKNMLGLVLVEIRREFIHE